MNILYINLASFLYGAERSLVELVRRAHGTRPLVLTDKPGPLSERLASENVPVLFLESDWSGGKLADFLAGVMEENRIDIVHLNKPHLQHLEFVREVRNSTREREIPVVVHVRSDEVDYDPGQLQVLAMMDQWVFVSDGIRQDFLDRHSPRFDGAILPPIDTIHDGRTWEEFEFSALARARFRSEFKFHEQDFVIGLIGYLHPVKGQDQLVHLADRLRVCPRMKFVMVGGEVPSMPGYSSYISSLVDEHQLRDRVFMTGYRDAARIYSGLDLVASLSQTEGFPGVLIEAMAAKRSVVACGVGGIPELIGNDGAGVIVPPGEVDEMENAIHALYSDSGLRREMGEAACKRAKRLFSARRMEARISLIYERLGSKPRCQRRIDTSEPSPG